MATARTSRTRKPAVTKKDDAPTWSADVDFSPREHVFSIGPVDYTMPVTCSAAQGWQYAVIVRKFGADAGFEWGARELLGEDEYSQVMTWDGLTPERFNFLVKVVTGKLLAAMSDPKAATA